MKVAVDTADRADKVLARHFPAAGRRELARLFDDGCVTLAGRRVRKGDRVAPGDELELARPPASGDDLRPLPEPGAPLDLLLERADLLAIAKPAGIPSQPLRAGELGTIANALAARFPECAALGDDPRDGGLVHRLDIGTSGVLIAARTPAAYRALRDAFSAGSIAKQYLALTDGRPVSRSCDAPLAQRGPRVVIDHTDGLSASTDFTVLRTSATHSLIRCDARTGRMHQVRAHLAHVGSPLTGDTRYGGAPLPDHPGFFLHASTIILPGPLTIEAPLPARFTAALAACGMS